MAHPRPGVRQSVLVVEMEGAVDRRRTNPHQVAVRAGGATICIEPYDGLPQCRRPGGPTVITKTAATSCSSRPRTRAFPHWSTHRASRGDGSLPDGGGDDPDVLS